MSDYTMTTTPLSAHSTCVDVGSGTGDFCYQATLMYGDTVIDTCTNLNFAACSTNELQSLLGPGVSYRLNGVENGGNASHLTTATLSCSGTFVSLIGATQTTCIGGQWDTTGVWTCQQSYSGLYLML